MGVVLMFDGAFEDAIDWFDKVLALHSETPHTVEIMLMWKSIAQFCLTGYEQAGAALKGISGLDYVKSLLLAACYAEIGRDEDARLMANRALHHRPGLRVSNIGLWRYFRETKDQDHLRRALIRAGLPA
jgi:hypothetical protein